MGGSAWIMMKIQKLFLYFFSIIVLPLTSIFFVLIPHESFAAGTLGIGEQCTDNSVCLTDVCEESDIDQKKYCVCNAGATKDTEGAQQCVQKYATQGQVATKWECNNGINASGNLNYCQYDGQVLSKFPGPTKSSSGLDILTDTSAAIQLNSAELNKLLKKPSLRINIPGVSFTDPSALPIRTEGNNTYIYFPYIGEYIAPVYKYGVIAIAVIAMIMIINAGFTWILSGGNSEGISKAQKGIVQAIIGLLIAITSYALLYLINPELVNFRSLRVLVVSQEQIEEIHEVDHAIANLPIDSHTTEVPTDINQITAQEFKKDTINDISVNGWTLWEGINEEQKKEILPFLFKNIAQCPVSEDIIKIPIQEWNLGSFKLSKNVIPGLQAAVDTAKKYGFEIRLSSGYRPIDQETQLWNTGLIARYTQGVKDWFDQNRAFIAFPACQAPHTSGGSIDMYLMKNGKKVTPKEPLMKTIDQYTNQYFSSAEPYVLVMEQMMHEAGWVRYCQESWHFEYGATMRYSKWTNKEARCVDAWNNWEVSVPDNVKAKANALTKVPIFQ
ncbi:MAG: hypothetical protein CO029_03575 [Candidatus Magasanikbacteria bacterium CG_4_9_14_0_2_um_filter_41_10]|uniref:D-alanyl-D-alanine carboxypeptidase-like core domain-containing protein n=1 Tax=Candidatus Magasanikbacteria bacterium CG_4_10_14_0_2_um_filter_41_31 TaxID=1974639 RepID=A0A2M7V3M8_9BACT|nr:MAG: hypothetical protein AUJ37_00160 [Candidatus Magasanikbacteria bacterium CG1_02_41_34]PIZ93104.1 MAG: hypothetical protein COX83_02750 [Candidatus Magasanikbacteria bacterium CG_4_10_14_0_2_um_filter_41_31]PJC53281.1 MAG: hypothetical protein CO029_03575 [Candidatus Magasanikbacteria bacterium CG_4_9_14_0_2_um_filter_41_10]